MSKSKSKITVGKWILEHVNTEGWRAGTRKKNWIFKPEDIYVIREAVGGRENLNSQVSELETNKIITVKWGSVHTVVEKITISMEQVDLLCEHENKRNTKNKVIEYKKYLKEQMQNTNCNWLLKYEEDLYRQLDKGTKKDSAMDKAMDKNIFELLNAIANLDDFIWKRKLSSDILGNSKTFEKSYESKIITILKNYSPLVTDELKDALTLDENGIKDTILAEHGILTYSQTLQLKGGIIYNVGAGDIDTSKYKYGTILNAQSISKAKLVSLKNVKHIITIENQANYEDMDYSENTLYVFTHGFLSPKERGFLSQINNMAVDDVTFEHWSDLDYGGIRIFLFMKNKVFPKVKPLNMDISTYKKLYKNTEGIVLTEDKRKLLEKIDAAELTDLKNCILKYGVEFEQETLI